MHDSLAAPAARPVPLAPPKLGRFDLWWRHIVAWMVPFFMVILVVGLAISLADNPEIVKDAAAATIALTVVLVWILGGAALGLLLALFRRKAPLAVAIGLSQLIWLFPSLVGFFAWSVVSLATRRRKVELIILTLCALAWPFTFFTMGLINLTGPARNVEAREFAFFAAIGVTVLLVLSIAAVGLYLAIGFYVGARRELINSLTERALTAERAQVLKIERARNIERSRIAREMHDVVAHRISLVSMNAGVLAYREDLPPEQRQEIARTIQENSSLALTELRSVLAKLREGGIEQPQPVLGDFDQLFEEARQAGMTLSVDVDLHDEESLAPNVSRHAYRTIQEALTNARKHAVNAVTSVTLKGAPGEGLTMQVRNPLTSSAQLPSAGLGLIGLAERAEIVGGTFWAGEERGEFVMKAWYPWPK